jgi:hypothetical protein
MGIEIIEGVVLGENKDAIKKYLRGKK